MVELSAEESARKMVPYTIVTKYMHESNRLKDCHTTKNKFMSHNLTFPKCMEPPSVKFSS